MNKQILHVDDSKLILCMVSEELTKRGYEVISLSDPTKVIKTLIETNIRICILDIQMPVLNGLELIEQIKQYDGGIQVIMMSGEMNLTSILDAHRLGAETCFFKPLESFEPLVESIDASIAKVNHWWNLLNLFQDSYSDQAKESVPHLL